PSLSYAATLRHAVGKPLLVPVPGKEWSIVSLRDKQSSIRLNNVDFLDRPACLICERMRERRADRGLRQLRSRLAAIGDAAGNRRVTLRRIGARNGCAAGDKSCHRTDRCYCPDHPSLPPDRCNPVRHVTALRQTAV